MIAILKSSERGHFDHGWLDTYHSFSFGDYHDPQRMGYRALRVINEDRVAPGQGFGMHRHRDMEIVTWVLEGALEHKDSLGHGEILRPGEAQRMTAGTGILHSEFNPSRTDPVHLLQIWILPDRRGHEPGYEQKRFPAETWSDRLGLIASPDGRDGSVTIHQDASIYVGRLREGGTVEHALAPGRHAWVQVARGSGAVNGQAVSQGDAAAIEDESSVRLKAGDREGAEFLLFDLG